MTDIRAGWCIAVSADIGAVPAGRTRRITDPIAVVLSTATGATAAGATTAAAAAVAAGHDAFHLEFAQFFYVLNAKLLHGC